MQFSTILLSVVIFVGFLSTGNGGETNNRVSSSSTRVWNTTGNLSDNNNKSQSSSTYSASSHPNHSSSSSIVRARMEISSSNNQNSNNSTISSRNLKTQTPTQAPKNLNSKNSPLLQQQSRNKPILNSLVTKLDAIATKLEKLSQTQVDIQKSFDNLESSFSNGMMEDVPQCGRRVERVLRTLTPLVSRVEGLWTIVSNGKNTNTVQNQINNNPSQFLGPPPNDVLLSESRRQERAISGIRNDLNIRTSQIMSELGTVEQQLDILQTNFKRNNAPSPLVEQIVQFEPDVQNLNDVTISGDSVIGSITNNGTLRVPNLVFPSVKNKPISESGVADTYPEALLTGSGQAGLSCAELFNQGIKRSGLYHLRLPGARSSFWQLLALCDQETSGGGWMVIQKRGDFGEPRESFHRNWIEYRSGFGDPLKELWMGNLNLHLLTTSEDQILRIELEDFDGEKRYAEYSTFKVASESDGFRLEVSGYSGDAGDALSDPWYGAHGSAFSTHDRDNDRSSLNCASMLKGGWWWKSCGRGLNGLYFDSPQPDSALARQGIVWFRWKGWDYTLRKATMMIRPKSFRPTNTTLTN